MSDEILRKLSELSETQREILVNQANHSKLLEKHSEHISEQNTILIRNTVTVEEHHRRSLSLEKRMDKMEEDFQPVKDHVAGLRGVGTAVKVLGAILGVVLSGFGLLTALKAYLQ